MGKFAQSIDAANDEGAKGRGGRRAGGKHDDQVVTATCEGTSATTTKGFRLIINTFLGGHTSRKDLDLYLMKGW